jgi:hypothetical protein
MIVTLSDHVIADMSEMLTLRKASCLSLMEQSLLDRTIVEIKEGGR